MEILSNGNKVNIQKFLNISVGCIIALGFVAIPTIALKNINNNYDKEQQYFQSIEQNPLVYDEKEVQDCKISYIESAHKNENNVYEQDLYLKTTCGEQISITRVKEKINTSRMKLAQNQTTDIRKNNM